MKKIFYYFKYSCVLCFRLIVLTPFYLFIWPGQFAEKIAMYLWKKLPKFPERDLKVVENKKLVFELSENLTISKFGSFDNQYRASLRFKDKMYSVYTDDDSFVQIVGKEGSEIFNYHDGVLLRGEGKLTDEWSPEDYEAFVEHCLHFLLLPF